MDWRNGLKMMRSTSFLVCAGIAGAVLLGFSGKPQAETSGAYRLGVQDRLRVHVSEWPALTGEVTIGADGNITMPTLGRIEATGLTMPELADAIAQRLRSKAGLQNLPDTTVDIAAYRPFYILGSVSNPGEYAYRPNMIILNALSLGGGIYRAEQISQWDVERAAISTRGELALGQSRRVDLLAEQMRWQAQLDGDVEMRSAPKDASPVFVEAVRKQQDIFAADLERDRAERAALENTITIRKAELEAIDRQLVDVAAKLESTSKELEKIRALAKRDLAVHRVGPLERALSDVQREEQGLEIQRLRSEQEINAARRGLGSLDEQRRSAALDGVQRVSAELRAVDEHSHTSARILDSAAFYAANLTRVNQDDTAPVLRFSIVRTTANGTVEFEAAETARVEPGDIIKVSRVSEPVTTGALTGSAPIETGGMTLRQ